MTNKFEVGDTVETADKQDWDSVFRKRIGNVLEVKSGSTYVVDLLPIRHYAARRATYAEEYLTLVSQTSDKATDLFTRVLGELPEDSELRADINNFLHPERTGFFLIELKARDPEKLVAEALDWIGSGSFKEVDKNGSPL